MSTTIIHRVGRAASPDAVDRSRALTAPLVGLSAIIGAWIARSRQRGALRELAERDDRDHLLQDAGITPEQARRASAKWFWQP
jgi:uncharacterized protein YjiS (DUF1127 family)